MRIRHFFSGTLAVLVILTLAGCGGGGVVIIPGDTTAPSVGFTGIIDGESINANRTIQVNVSDSQNIVTLVEMLVDNAVVTTTVGTEANITVPFTVVWNPAFAGQHTLAARVRDAANNSQVVTLDYTILAGVPNPGDTTPPSVAITGISDGDSINADRNIQFNVADTQNIVTLVEVLVDNVVITTTPCQADDVNVPFTLSYNPAFAGPHTVGARVRDAANNSQTVSLNFTIVP